MIFQQSPKIGRPGRRYWRGFLLGGIALASLVILTAWNLTRSDALIEARQAYKRGDATHCLQSALDHLDRQPWSREAALHAARSLSLLDYATEAEPYYRRAGAMELNDLQIRAYGLVRGNYREDAIQAYEEILARWPENVTALRRLAAVQLSQNNYQQLLTLSQRLDQVPNGAAVGATLRGVIAHNEREFEQAVASFERVVELDPDLQEMPLPRGLFWSQFAEDLMSCGRYEQTARYLAKALESGPDALLMVLLGRAYFQQGKLDEAERCFHDAAEWNPKDYGPHLDLGKLDLQRKSYSSALNHLERALAISPRQTDVLYVLARVHHLLGHTTVANHIEETMKQLRSKPAVVSHPAKGPWPRYAL
jgi:tetratricopeptide (TPR) repeat protein